MVPAAKEISGVHLDYSVISLADVDQIVQAMQDDGVTQEQVAETLFCLGCYVGEVFVRNAEGRWRLAAETPMADVVGFPLVIELDDESYCNPIGKVFKRLENGMEDYLPYFYAVFCPSEPG
jgi:hypothetical protein